MYLASATRGQLMLLLCPSTDLYWCFRGRNGSILLGPSLGSPPPTQAHLQPYFLVSTGLTSALGLLHPLLK